MFLYCHNTHSTGRTAIHLTTHEPTRQKLAASKEGKLAVCKEGEKIALYSVAFQSSLLVQNRVFFIEIQYTLSQRESTKHIFAREGPVFVAFRSIPCPRTCTNTILHLHKRTNNHLFNIKIIPYLLPTKLCPHEPGPFRLSTNINT